MTQKHSSFWLREIDQAVLQVTKGGQNQVNPSCISVNTVRAFIPEISMEWPLCPCFPLPVWKALRMLVCEAHEWTYKDFYHLSRQHHTEYQLHHAQTSEFQKRNFLLEGGLVSLN